MQSWIDPGRPVGDCARLSFRESGVFVLEPMKELLSSMRDRFAGRPAAVLGGGPSLPADLRRLPDDCLLIAVNHHAFYHCRPDFMVYNDHQDGRDKLFEQAVRNPRAVRVSPEPTSDVVFDVPVWTGFYSSNTAAWFALWLGCSPVILCGMDLYQGQTTYCHPVGRDEPQWHYPLEHHLRPWAEECKLKVPHPERLVAMSGPLTNIFGAYHDPAHAVPC